MPQQHVSRAFFARYGIIGALWAAGAPLLAAFAFISPHPARAVPAFAQQTGQPCKACHVGGFGPELTTFGREFKLGGYTLRTRASVPLALVAIASWTRTRKDQVPPPEHLNRNDNLVLDQASLFVAGGIGSHFGGFAQLATYDGVARTLAWDNIDLRAVTSAKLLGSDSVLGLSLNNNPTVQDSWNSLPAWGFPYTDTAVSPTPAAGLLIDGALAQKVLGLTSYAWIGHKLYVEGGVYSSPPSRILKFVGIAPTDAASLHGLAPYGRIAFQTILSGGSWEVGANGLRAAIFPGGDRPRAFTDSYSDWGVDSSWLKTLGKSDMLSANLRFEHENASLRATCALAIGSASDPSCVRNHLNEWRASIRYSWRNTLGITLSPFSISGSRNLHLNGGNGRPNSNGLTTQLDYTLWPNGSSPLGPLVNARVGIQYTIYGKFDGRRHNFDNAGSNAVDNQALRLFTWLAF